MELFKILGKFAIDGINKAIKEMEDATGVAKETKTATEAYGISLEKLSSKVLNQQREVNMLKSKYADLCLTHGKNSKEARECAESIEKLSTELGENQRRLREAEDAAEQFDRSLDGVGDAAEQSSQGVGGLIGKLGESMSSFEKFGASVIVIGKALLSLADNTREYRTEMGKLDTAFRNAGHSAANAEKTYKTLQSVLGESDRSVEAANHLAKLTDNEKDLQIWTDICTGVFATFGDSLPIEGLTEAANETAKVGQVVGVLADALNWAGVSEEEFNRKLAACNDEHERTRLITETLNGLYKNTADAYKRNNKAVIEANAAQEKWNAAMAKVGAIVEPVVTIIKSGLADAITSLADAATGNTDYWVGTLETVDEAGAKVEELTQRIEDLLALDPAYWTDIQQQEYDHLRISLAEAEAQYQSMLEQQEAAAAAAADPANKFRAATEEYAASATELLNKFQENYTQISEAVGGWFTPFEEAKTTVTTSINEMMAAMQSQVDFNASYSDNLQALKSYGLESLSEAFQSYGADGAAYAAAIVQAVEQAGGATTEGGQQVIQGLLDMNSQVQSSQDELAQTMTLYSGEFDSAIQEMVKTLATGVEDMNMGAEAYVAAFDTINEYLRGIETQTPGVVSAMSSLARQMKDALTANLGTIQVGLQFVNNGDGYPAKNGLDYVPYDEFPARLHKGEAVLTAEEAAAWRAGKAVGSGNTEAASEPSGGMVINQYITAVAQTPVELAATTAAYFEQARWAI